MAQTPSIASMKFGRLLDEGPPARCRPSVFYCHIDYFLLKVFTIDHYGPLAHLVERFHGMEEVKGSIPLRSTKICVRKFFPVSLSIS